MFINIQAGAVLAYYVPAYKPFKYREARFFLPGAIYDKIGYCVGGAPLGEAGAGDRQQANGKGKGFHKMNLQKVYIILTSFDTTGWICMAFDSPSLTLFTTIPPP